MTSLDKINPYLQNIEKQMILTHASYLLSI